MFSDDLQAQEPDEQVGRFKWEHYYDVINITETNTWVILPSGDMGTLRQNRSLSGVTAYACMYGHRI